MMKQRRRARLQGGAGGTNIVHQQHPLAGQSLIKAEESIRHVGTPLHGVERRLGSGLSLTDHRLFVEGEGELPGELSRQESSLVVTPLAQTAGVQGHRDDDINWQLEAVKCLHQEGAQRPGQVASPVVFEAMNRRAHRSAKSGRRADTMQR